MSDKIISGGTGIGFLSALTLIFITLRLMGIITWSWWWVLGPLWIPASILVLVAIIVVVISAFVD